MVYFSTDWPRRTPTAMGRSTTRSSWRGSTRTAVFNIITISSSIMIDAISIVPIDTHMMMFVILIIISYASEAFTRSDSEASGEEPYRCPRRNTLLLREPVPSKMAASTPLRPLISCVFEANCRRGLLLRRSVFFTDTGRSHRGAIPESS